MTVHKIGGTVVMMKKFDAEGALAANALMASGDIDPAHPARIALCRFFAENIAVGAKGLEETVLGGAGFLQDANLALAS